MPILKFELTFVSSIPSDFKLQHPVLAPLFRNVDLLNQTIPLEKLTLTRTGLVGSDVKYTIVCKAVDGRTFMTEAIQLQPVTYKPSSPAYWIRSHLAQIADCRDSLMDVANHWAVDLVKFELG